jgi:hypothetical protein
VLLFRTAQTSKPFGSLYSTQRPGKITQLAPTNKKSARQMNWPRVCPSCLHVVSRRSLSTSMVRPREARPPSRGVRPKRAVEEVPLEKEDPFSPLPPPKRGWQPHFLNKFKGKERPPDVKKLFDAEIAAFDKEPAGLATLAGIIEEDPELLQTYAKEWSQRHRGVFQNTKNWTDRTLV